MTLGLAVAVAAGWLYAASESYGAIEPITYEPEESVAAIENLTEGQLEEAASDIRAIEDALLAEELAAQEAGLLDDIMAAAAEQGRLFDEAQYDNPLATSPELPDDMFRSYLLVGADASGYLADVIILFLQPTDGAAPILVSLPRDLYVPNSCSGGYTRLNANLGGCTGVANGPTLLSLSVANFTGIRVDHFGVVNFDGFSRVIDTLGGVDLCFPNPTRDTKSHLDVSAGCQRADGATTLAWVRSRRTEELVGEEWVSLGASDFSRQRNQQDVLFLVASKLSSFSSLSSFSAVADSLASSVRLDSGLSFTNALSLAWDYRGLSKSQVNRLSVKYENYRTDRGAQVLVPTVSFNDALATVYPKAAR